MKIQTTMRKRSALLGLAGIAVAFSSTVCTAQEEGGRRRGRPEVQDGDAPNQRGESRGGPIGQRGGPGGRGPGGPEGRGPGGPFGPGGPGGPEMMMRLPIMMALDADRDGVISAQEIEGAAAALRTLDKNNDGKLVFQEIVPQRGGPGAGPGGDRPGGDRPGGDRPGGDRPGGDRPGGDRPGAFGGMDPKAMVDRMMQQDKDGDGLLSGDEIPERMSQMVERADSNSDGKLSRDEIEKAMARLRRGGGDRPGAGRPGGTRDADTPGGERPRRPAAE
ncbi:MAG: hypothetical protein KDB00_27250 [Planctomycetales bacterium]|nr:hypothetical protein [Planctomycetales bacterium]